MNVFFCDHCGVRVTDVDLRGGHGIRRSHDVICATCLEQGHGKDWLAQAAPAKAKAAAPVASHPLIDAARDRAHTRKDDEAAPVIPIPDPAIREDDTLRVPVPQANLAGAAAGFGALGAEPAGPAPALDAEPAEMEVEEPTDEQPGQADEAPPAPETEADDDQDAGKRETRPTPAVRPSEPRPRPPPRPGSGRHERPGSNRMGNKPSGKASTPPPTAGKDARKSTSTKRTVPLKTRSAKQAAYEEQKKMLFVTLGGVGLIIIIGLIVIGFRTGALGGDSKQTGPATIDMKEYLTKVTSLKSDVMSACGRAYDTNRKEDWLAARNKIQALQAACQDFESVALRGKWTQANVDHQMDKVKVQDALGKMKMVNDALMILEQREKSGH